MIDFNVNDWPAPAYIRRAESGLLVPKYEAMLPGFVPAFIGLGSSIAPGSITYDTAGTHNFIVPIHNQLVVELWGAGGGGTGVWVYSNDGDNYVQYEGTDGGSTRWNGGAASSRPQANGGGRGRSTGTLGLGGTAVNGDTNTTGQSSQGPSSGAGGAGANGGAGGAYTGGLMNVPGAAGSPPGGGGASGLHFTGGWSTDGYGRGGGGGGYCLKTYLAGVYAVGASIPVVVGAPGNGGPAGSGRAGGPGAVGRARISWS
ncbi:MAG: hypothetical protein B7Z29_01795 [Hyphomicrobium sp. 12-62-95]|nr:MAG: hypothetical protein B7Z29_01795 [Hyphomicrobium sp. 12-62-95]